MGSGRHCPAFTPNTLFLPLHTLPTSAPVLTTNPGFTEKGKAERKEERGWHGSRG